MPVFSSKPELPSVSDARKQTNNCVSFLSRSYVISKINYAISKGRYKVELKGQISDELREELKKSGYGVISYDCDGLFNRHYYTEISWDKR